MKQGPHPQIWPFPVAVGLAIGLLFSTSFSLASSKFQTGFDSSRPAKWSKWQGRDSATVPDEETAGSQEPVAKPAVLEPLDDYKAGTNEDPVVIASKIDGLLESLRQPVANLYQNTGRVERAVNAGLALADKSSALARRMSDDVSDMYVTIDRMHADVNANYDTLNTSERTPETDNDFNQSSDGMAEQVAGFRDAVAGMLQRLDASKQALGAQDQAIDNASQSEEATLEFSDKVSGRVDEVAGRFDEMNALLAKADAAPPADLPAQVKSFLSSVKTYADAHKPKAEADLAYAKASKSYLQSAQDFLDQVRANFLKVDEDLKVSQDFFRRAKVNLAHPFADDVTDVCAAASKPKGPRLQNAMNCAKSCRRPCQFKQKVDNEDCFTCPSPSQGSCADVKALPANHAWCQPGGICYEDPQLYCQPFGSLGPNNEVVQCTNCKERPDECFKKVGDGTQTFTHCKQGCWNGRCVYKGKYQEAEWDGKPEFMHCYKCETPPGPPDCEAMNWGTTLITDCEKMCMAPGVCEKVKETVPGAPVPQQQQGKGQQKPKIGGWSDVAQGGAQGKGKIVSTGQTRDKTPDEAAVEEANKPNPPTGTPGKGEAGGNAQPAQPGQPGQGSGKVMPPKFPTLAKPAPIKAPNIPKPEPPKVGQPRPPESWASFYRRWMKTYLEKIRERQKILADKNASPELKAEAQRQLDSLTREKQAVEEKADEAKKKSDEEIRRAEEERRKSEEAERNRAKQADYAAEAARKAKLFKLSRLKKATDALKEKLQEARDSIKKAQKRVQDAQDRVDALKKAAQTESVKKKLAEAQAELAKQKGILQREEAGYSREIAELQTEYQRALWDVDPDARHMADAQRMDEYAEMYNELKNKEQVRQIRNQAMNDMLKGLEESAAAAESRGDSKNAEYYRKQIENLKREQDRYNETMDRQEQRLKDNLHNLGVRNLMDGAGPASDSRFGEKLGEYAQQFQNDIEVIQKQIEALRANKNLTPADQELIDKLSQKKADLEASLTGVKQNIAAFKNPQLADDVRENVIKSSQRLARSYAQTNEQSMGEIIAETAKEEAIDYYTNPLRNAKKTIAFGYGMGKGAVEMVKGAAELGYKVTEAAVYGSINSVRLVAQSLALQMGYEETFGTDAIETFNNGVSAVWNASASDMMYNGFMAAGKMIDDKINQLEHARDVDWACSEFGGEVAINVIGPDGAVVIGKEVYTAGKAALTGAEVAGEAAEAAKALRAAEEAAQAGKAAAKIEEASGALRIGEEAGATRLAAEAEASRALAKGEEAAEAARAGAKGEEAAEAGRIASKGEGAAVDAGKTAKLEEFEPGAVVEEPPAAVKKGVKAPEVSSETPTGFEGPEGIGGTRIEGPTSETPTGIESPEVKTPVKAEKPTGPTPKVQQEIAEAKEAIAEAQPKYIAENGGKPVELPETEYGRNPGGEVPVKIEGPAVKSPTRIEGPASETPTGFEGPEIKSPSKVEKSSGLTPKVQQEMADAKKVIAEAQGKYAAENGGKPVEFPETEYGKNPGGEVSTPKIEGPAAKSPTVIEGPAKIEGPAAKSPTVIETPTKIEGPAAKSPTVIETPTKIESPEATAGTRIEGPAAKSPTKIEGVSREAPTERIGESFREAPTERIEGSFREAPTEKIRESFREAPTERIEEPAIKSPAGGGKPAGPTPKIQQKIAEAKEVIAEAQGKYVAENGGKPVEFPETEYGKSPGVEAPKKIEGPAAKSPTKIEGPEATAGTRIEGPPKIEGQEAMAGTRIERPAKIEGQAVAKGEEAADAGRVAAKGEEAVDAGKTAKLEEFEPGPIKEEPPVAKSKVKPEKAEVKETVGDAPGKAAAENGGKPAEMPKAESAKTPDVRAPPEPVVPPKVNERPFVQIGENESFVAKNSKGEAVNVQTGKELGHGSSSKAFIDAADKEKVVRVTQLGAEDAPYARQLDQTGRAVVEKIQKPNGPVRIVDKYGEYVIENPANPSQNKIVESVQLAKNGSADKMILEQGGKMTPGQTQALDEAMREINRNGAAWLDNHPGNYSFEKVPGAAAGEDKWKVVVIDGGGIVPVKGATAAERAENAAALQKRINVQTEQFLDEMEWAKTKVKKVRDGVLNDERHRIMDAYGSKIDTDAIGIPNTTLSRSELTSQFRNGDKIFDYLQQNGAFTKMGNGEGVVGDISKTLEAGLDQAFGDDSAKIIQMMRDSRASSKVGFYPGGTMGNAELQSMWSAEGAAKAAAGKK